MSWKNSNQPALGLADEMLLEHEVKKLDPIQTLIDWDAIENHPSNSPNKRRGSAPENAESLVATGVV